MSPVILGVFFYYTSNLYYTSKLDTPRKSTYHKDFHLKLQSHVLLVGYHTLAHLYHFFGRINSKKILKILKIELENIS